MKAGPWGVGRGAWVLLLVVACTPPRQDPPLVDPEPMPAPPASAPAPTPRESDAPRLPPQRPKARVAPPDVAFRLGLMPLASTGVSGWRLLQASYDGRGVLIGILDGGIDPGIAGLQTTTTDAPKVLDLRDFSGEGEVQGGLLRELQFGDLPQGDLNGDGDNRDVFAVETARDSAGWKARIDLDGNGSLEGETWYRDYLVARETFTFGPQGGVTAALNLSDGHTVVYLDNSGHGSHVSGIAAGYNLYGQRGFQGVAPGAQLLGLKIADNLRGSVSTTGSMVQALEYARRFARERSMPLVLNMSFGVGNAQPGRAVMDSIIDAFLIANPDVVFMVSAGNDGPGTETMGLPASSELATTIGATYPASFAGVQFGAEREVLGWWSSRGGSTAKPDLVTPGVAYSSVPAWKTGDEINGGTSMASPHAAGLAALLVSALRQNNRTASAAEIVQALRMSSLPVDSSGLIDQGFGLPDVRRAWTWLQRRRGSAIGDRIRVEAMAPEEMGSVAPARQVHRAPGAYRRNGLRSAADTLQRFRISSLGQGPAGSYRLVSDGAWLTPAESTVTIGSTGSAVVAVRYDAPLLAAPGRYTATIRGVPVSDSSAGPAFVLANTIIVPETSVTVNVTRQLLRRGMAARWFVNVPEGTGGLVVRAAVRDVGMSTMLALYEPSGRPARHDKAVDFGGHRDSLRTTVVVDPADCVPGVWEVVLLAYPGADVGYDLSIEAPQPDASTRVLEWVGADTVFTAPLAATPTRRTFAVPEWATMMVAEVEVTPELWNELTDFAITMFDSAGVRLGTGAMNYPTHRVAATIPGVHGAGYTATLDLFPAFARMTASPGAQARVRLRFEGAARQPAVKPAIPAGWGHVGRERTGSDPRTALTRLIPLE